MRIQFQTVDDLPRRDHQTTKLNAYLESISKIILYTFHSGLDSQTSQVVIEGFRELAPIFSGFLVNLRDSYKLFPGVFSGVLQKV